MNPEEYANLARVEATHWYYAGKRELVRRWLARAGRPAAGDTLLDCGAGTGCFAREMRSFCRVRVLDDHAESLAILRRNFASEEVLELGADGIPLPDASVDVVTALDVLEHIKEDSRALDDMHRVLKPGGVLVATVPAGMELWSDWDEVLHHHRRYSRRTLRALFADDRWRLTTLHYTNVVVYPAVWFLRRLFRGRGNGRSEDMIPWRPLNWMLRAVFVRMGLWAPPLPFGVSLLVVAVRR